MVNPHNAIDKLALGLSAASMLLGIVVLGVVEVLAGAPYGAAPMTNDAGEVVATPAIDPNIRVGLVLLGILILFLWGLYKVFQPAMEVPETDRVESPAD